MSLKHAILGFLSFKSLSGYDLKKAFDSSVQHFWPANQSQIYRTLARMKQEGLVVQEVIEREERLDMKLYHITETGREELHRWLSTPLPAQDYREPFLIQLYFGGKLSDDELVKLLQHEIHVLEAQLEDFDLIYKTYAENGSTHEDQRAYFLSFLTLEFGILNNQAAITWLNSVLERVETRNYTLRFFNVNQKIIENRGKK